MSLRRGTPLRVVLPSPSRHAAMIGNALFLLPLISILPLSRCPPRMRKLSIALPCARRPEGGPRGAWAVAPRRPVPERFGLSAGPSADVQSIPVALAVPRYRSEQGDDRQHPLSVMC